MKYRVAGLTALLLASAAYASDTPLYNAPAGWVDVADLAKATAHAGGPLLIQDMQVRAADETVTTYSDFAVRIDSPQALTQLGTLTAQWMPDKGDLVVHRAALVRDGTEIDLLKGVKFTVLRREQQLEQRTLSGMLTATMPVAGARVGDVVRLTYSVSVTDKALKGQVQDGNAVPYFPFTPGLGRLRISWPQDQDIQVSGGPRFALPAATTQGGFKQIEVSLDRPKPDEMPGDAPGRYSATPVVELSSFADWPQVSKTMAPLFATEGAIESGGPIAAEVVRIAASSADPMARAGAALRLVQERIAYLAEGMDGGNYVPQSSEKTWETRYGDCKAKTLLLTAMLRELGIEAEPVLVNAVRGDAVVEDLPMPGAFNHVLVRAEVDGKDLWLDGTGLGSGIGSLGDVPPFAWGLPLRSEGAGLLKLANRAPALASVSITNRIDMSAGVDFPILFDLKVVVAGQMGAMLQQVSNLPDNEQRRELIDGMVGSFMGQAQVFERDLSFDQATGITSISAKGMAGSAFDLKDKRAEYAPNLFAGALSFDANRSKALWRDIPVALTGADRRKTDITVILPPLEGYTLEGGTVHALAAGAKVDREAKLDGSTLRIVEEVATTGGEIAPADIAKERAGFAALAANSLRLQAPANAPRSWDSNEIDPARLKAVETAYGKLIAENPDESGYYFGRASFFTGLRDHKRAVADLDKAVALDESADNLAARADAKLALGDFTGASADLAKAAELDPGGGRVAQQALVMGLAGQSDAALPLVEQAIVNGGDDKPILIPVKAELLARLDRGEEGAAALSELAADRPGDAFLLNAQCWFAGIWQVQLESAAKDCEAAVVAGDYAPAVLDSRAMANFRLGKLDAALADANAVLGRNPGQEQTLLLRGVIRTRQGDRAGAADIAEALRRRPGLKAEYEGYGLLPAK